MNVYHHLARFFFPAPSLQLSSTSDESLALLYLSLSDEVELMATFTPADVISVLRLEEQECGIPAGSFCCPTAHEHKHVHVYKNGSYQLLMFSPGKNVRAEISRVCLKERVAVLRKV